MLPPSQAGAFEKMSDQQDERVNDGNHYKGLMSRDDYVRKRTEVGERPKTDDEKLAEVHAIARERVLAERRVKDAAGTDRARVAYKSHTSLTHKSHTQVSHTSLTHKSHTSLTHISHKSHTCLTHLISPIGQRPFFICMHRPTPPSFASRGGARRARGQASRQVASAGGGACGGGQWSCWG